MDRYLTKQQALIRLGHPGYRRLLPFLLKRTGVTPIQIGKRVAIAESDLPRLRAALAEWKDRPRIARSAR